MEEEDGERKWERMGLGAMRGKGGRNTANEERKAGWIKRCETRMEDDTQNREKEREGGRVKRRRLEKGQHRRQTKEGKDNTTKMKTRRLEW